ncbi:hypothetical protein ACFE04_006782 [Oxalis oulophora]
MDDFFHDYQPNFWYDDYYVPVNASAFVPYVNGENWSSTNVPKSGNMNKRMIEILRRNWPMNNHMVAHGEDRDRLTRHMINERMRRDREKQNYLALHSLLPLGTKNDKKSIVQTAKRTIEELKSYRDALDRRKHDEPLMINSDDQIQEEWTQVKFQVSNPKSGVSLMVEVLKCLNNFGTKTRSIRSKFSDQEFLAVIEIQTQVDAARKVERDVQRTLHEIERKFKS